MAGRFSVEAVFKAVDRLTAPVSRMQNRVGKFTRTMQRGLRSVNRTLDKTISSIRTGGARAIGFLSVALTGLTAATLGFIKQASLIEDATAAFTPLLGSVKRAEELVAKLNKTAASTPFQFETLSKSAGQLLPVMNGDIETTIKLVRMLGDTAGGNAQKLDSITRGFTKAMLKGKVDMESLNMIAEAGVPIFTELASSMGTKVNAAFFKMISAGKVATTDLTKAFEKMTSKGGVFFEGMDIASRTQSGLWSTLKDNISLTAAAIGQQILPISKGYTKEAIKIAQGLREWVNMNRELIGQRIEQTIAFITDNFATMVQVATAAFKIIGGLVAVSLALKTVMFANTILMKGWAVAVFTLKAALVTFNVVMGAARLGVLAFNLAFAANPIGAVILAVGALIGLGVLLINNWDSIVAAITSAVSVIKPLLDIVASPFRDLFQGVSTLASAAGGLFGGGDEQQVVTPQDRTARSIEEKRETSTADVTIRDETGRAEMKQTGKTRGAGINLVQSGAF